MYAACKYGLSEDSVMVRLNVLIRRTDRALNRKALRRMLKGGHEEELFEVASLAGLDANHVECLELQSIVDPVIDYERRIELLANEDSEAPDQD